MISPRVLFRTFAIAEFATWGLLIAALVVRFFTGSTVFSTLAGGLHGFVFLCYGVVTVFVWINQRWRPWLGLLGLLTTLIPFATLPFELSVDRRGLLSTQWRLGMGGELPSNLFERVQSWVLRRPALAASIALAGVVVAFCVLLILGPPVPRD